jgi:hypothetical protein
VGTEGIVELGRLSPVVLLFLLTGIPRLVLIEKGVDITAAHDEVIETFERYLRAVGSRAGGSGDE